jgi:N-acylneuraminate cytidylyltransferase
MRLAIIPARGGSKRIPRKNIKLFGGKPMIAWSIEAAKQSECFDRIIVSTDDSEIAEVAISYGAEVPFMRPPELSDDHTGTTKVVAHAVDWHNKNNNLNIASNVCCIYATAPFIRAKDIAFGLSELEFSGAQYAFSVTSYAFPIQRAIRINSNKFVEMYQPQNFDSRSQDLEEAYHDAAQFYWGRAEAWLADVPMFSASSIAIRLQRHMVQDIDTDDDWLRAELIYKSGIAIE